MEHESAFPRLKDSSGIKPFRLVGSECVDAPAADDQPKDLAHGFGDTVAGNVFASDDDHG
jgi:hypothetical protein